MEEIQRTNSGDTLNKQEGIIKQQEGDFALNNLVLASCRLNAYSSPPVLKIEEVPVSTPKYMEKHKEVTEQDMYFLRWVFRDNFDKLTSEVETKFPGHRILRAESEPGISWEDFRNDNRGLLIWLVKVNNNPLDELFNIVSKQNIDDKVQMSLVFSNIQKQVGNMRRSVHKLRQEVDNSERVLLQICEVIKEGLVGSGVEDSIISINGDGNGHVNGNGNLNSSLSGIPNTNGVYGSSTTLSNFIYPQDGIPDIQQLAISMRNGNGHHHTTTSSDGVQKEAAEWSVVEDDDDDDRELTSASLSGYDDEYDSD